MLKSHWKNAQNHGIIKRAGFVAFGLQTLILQSDEVQSALSTLPKPFFICWVLDVWDLNEIWQNRVFGQFSLPFLCVNSGILYNYISFVGIFFGSEHQLDEAHSLKKENENISFMKNISQLILILDAFCKLKLYFERHHKWWL